MLPESTQDRPWPLSELPSVQPHWDPAMAHDACTEEWPKRHVNDADAKRYVAAWCRIRASDRGAVDELGRLARDARSEIARPARTDSVNLIADWMDARHAMAWLDSMSIESVATLDLLAGTYVALGMRDEAAVVEERIAAEDPRPPAATRCERMALYAHLDEPGLGARVRDCSPQLAGAVMCVTVGYWHAPCADVFNNEASRDGKLVVSRLYRQWSGAHRKLLEIANGVTDYLYVTGAEEVAVVALENAVRAGPCDGGLIDSVVKTADRLRAAERHQNTFDARLAALRDLSAARCRELANR